MYFKDVCLLVRILIRNFVYCCSAREFSIAFEQSNAWLHFVQKK